MPISQTNLAVLSIASLIVSLTYLPNAGLNALGREDRQLAAAVECIEKAGS